MRHFDLEQWKFHTIIQKPFEQIAEIPLGTRIGALGIAIGQYLWNDLFSWVLLLLVGLMIVDYYLGTKVIPSLLNASDEPHVTSSPQIRSESPQPPAKYSPRAAQATIYGKVCGVILLFAVRILEGLAQWKGLFIDTKGTVAAGLAGWLVVAEMRSLAKHRREFGESRWPVLDTFLDWLESLFEARLPKPPAGRQSR